MAFEPIQKFFPSAARSFGLGRTIEAVNICKKFQDLLPRFFANPEAQKNISAKSYSNKTLHLIAVSPLWSQEILMRKENIIKEMNQEFGANVIEKIKTELTNTPFSGAEHRRI
ncbi:DUF721 domain-containing protein [Candidatus Peregrinibacteria bacterium]|nr:DUF721 domain-containing protein [Candidatus Peregrinibacteria bacterium]